MAEIIFCYQIHHSAVLVQSNIGSFQSSCQQFACDFLAGNIFVKQNPLVRVAPLSGKFESLPVFFKIHTVINEFTDYMLGRADHNIHRFLSVFVMTGPHGIFKITVIVLFGFQHTDAALSQERVTVFGIILGNKSDCFV